MNRVIIGMDPHKRSVMIEVMAKDETVFDGGRYATDRAGYTALLRDAQRWPERVWAIEGCSGIGRHVATRLLADGEQVVDVPPKLSARVRVFSTGQGRKTDATRRALGRSGWHPDGRAATGRRRPAARGVAGPGRPAPGAR